jgi:hypothetical protein
MSGIVDEEQEIVASGINSSYAVGCINVRVAGGHAKNKIFATRPTGGIPMRWTVHMPHDNAERGGNAVEAIFLGFKWAQLLDSRFSSTGAV